MKEIPESDIDQFDNIEDDDSVCYAHFHIDEDSYLKVDGVKYYHKGYPK